MRVPYTKTDRWMLLVSVGLLLGVGLWLLLRWPSIPPTTPTHYGFSGAADAWGGKGSLWLLWGMGAATIALVLICGHFPKSWSVGISTNARNRAPIYRACRAMLSQITLVLSLLFCYLTVMGALGRNLGIAFWLVMLGVFAPIIRYFFVVHKLR